MKKDIFKVGDSVYCLIHGWGIVSNINTCAIVPVEVDFKDESNVGYTTDGRYFVNAKPTLSFTEYILENFSQERPIELPEVGELCLVRDDESLPWRVREFAFEYHGTFNVKEPCGSTDCYVHMKRIKILD